MAIKIGTTIDSLRNRGGFCSQYQAVYDAYTTKPSDAVALIWDTFVSSIVSSGEWAKLDIFYLYAAHTNGDSEALINWVNPGTFDATAYNAPPFVASQGFTGDIVNRRIDCNWIPSASAVNFTQNSASQIIYIRSDVSSNTGFHGTGVNADNKNCLILNKSATNFSGIQTNDATTVTSAGIVTDGSGLYINTRTAAAVKKLYRNKVAIIETTTVSTGVPTHSPYCLCSNDDNVATAFKADQVAMYAWGGGFTQTNVNNFTDAFETAMDALGTGVIP